MERESPEPARMSKMVPVKPLIVDEGVEDENPKTFDHVRLPVADSVIGEEAEMAGWVVVE